MLLYAIVSNGESAERAEGVPLAVRRLLIFRRIVVDRRTQDWPLSTGPLSLSQKQRILRESGAREQKARGNEKDITNK